MTLPVKYRLTRSQLAYRRSKALYRGLVGGIGSGKSWIGALDVILRSKPGRLYMAVGPSYVMLKDASLRSFLLHVNQLGVLQDFRRSDMTAVLKNGCEVLFRTADDPDRLRGPNLSGVWLDEASLMDREVFDIIIGRLREGGEQGWLGATFTPKGRAHWTFKTFAGGDPDSAVFRSRTSDNPYLHSRFESTIRRQYTPEMSRQELEGEFIEDGTAFLFPDSWLELSIRAAESLRGVKRFGKGIGIDPAEGGDKTSMCCIDEFGIVELVSKRTPDTSVITGEAIAFMAKHGVPSEMVCFDRGGGGKEHADRLRSQGYKGVRTVAFGESLMPDPRRGKAQFEERKEQREDRYAYRFRRDEMFWELRQKFDPSLNQQVFAVPAEYTELRHQLSVFPLVYDHEGRMKLPPKNKRSVESPEKSLVELVGHSPDEADALALALHAMLHKPIRMKAGAMK